MSRQVLSELVQFIKGCCDLQIEVENAYLAILNLHTICGEGLDEDKGDKGT